MDGHRNISSNLSPNQGKKERDGGRKRGDSAFDQRRSRKTLARRSQSACVGGREGGREGEEPAEYEREKGIEGGRDGRLDQRCPISIFTYFTFAPIVLTIRICIPYSQIEFINICQHV